MPDDEPRCDDDLLVRIEGGDEWAMTELFTRHRERLRQTIRLRLDRRLQGRIDSSDVLQPARTPTFEIARRGAVDMSMTQTCLRSSGSAS